MQHGTSNLQHFKDPHSAETAKLGRALGLSCHEIVLAFAMYSRILECREAKSDGVITRYVLYCWISDSRLNYTDAEVQRIACAAKLGLSGIGFHEFVSSCSALFAGRLCAAKADAFTLAVSQCHLFHGDARGGPPSLLS